MPKLPIKESNGYLILADLPHNCLFNKVWTGCGATTIALTNYENYIIAVPTTELVQNKCYPPKDKNANDYNWQEADKHPGISPVMNLFGAYGSSDAALEHHLKEYLQTDGVKKIICTYDKVPFILRYIKSKEYRFLCDEYHSFLELCLLRDNAIKGILDNYKLFKSFCFMSATPLSDEFKPMALEGITEYVADWKEKPCIKIQLAKTNKVFAFMANVIKDYQRDGYIEIDGIKSYEAFVFVNSVTDIRKIIDHCNLNAEECRIICADNPKNRKTLTGYTISSSSSPTKKYNFITRKSFEGVDYYSETGMCFVVSSSGKAYTLLGIETDIPQIAGRIRTKTNPFRYSVIHVFDTPKEDKDIIKADYADVLAATKKQEQFAQERVEAYNNFSEEAKKQQIKELTPKDYIRYNATEDKFVVNDMAGKLELYKYKQKNLVYHSGKNLMDAYRSSGIETTDVMWEVVLQELDEDFGNKQSFEDTLKEYIQLREEHPLGIGGRITEIEEEYPFLNNALHKLGKKQLLKLRSQKKIKEALNPEKLSDDLRIVKEIEERYELGSFISNAEAKLLAKQYGGTTGKALNKWMSLQEKQTTIYGVRVKGYVITGFKRIFD